MINIYLNKFEYSENWLNFKVILYETYIDELIYNFWSVFKVLNFTIEKKKLI